MFALAVTLATIAAVGITIVALVGLGKLVNAVG